MIDLRIVHFTDQRIADPRAERGLGADEVEYQLNRNLVVGVCRRHGRVGSLGCARFASDVTKEGMLLTRKLDFEPPDAEPHAFYVVYEQYNSERYIYLELLDPHAITREWLVDLCDTVRWQMQGWGVFIDLAPSGSGVMLLPPVALVSGHLFEKCSRAEDLLELLRNATKLDADRIAEDRRPV